MEYQVGEIVEIGGNKYQVIEDNDGLFCENCCFDYSMCSLYPLGPCVRHNRKDKKDVCFKLI